ncbi:MAG: hypothetical protein IPM48_00925 [Saprospiraceae bacterium]|nr:hypothetical protein [Saprospiraceae bacterium]
MTNVNRYNGDPIRMYDLMDVFIVHCPKCKGRAEIKVNEFLRFKSAKLRCSKCFFSENALDRTRYRSSGTGWCMHCSSKLSLKIEERKTMPSYLLAHCPECNKKSKIRENWETFVMKYNDEGIIDPAFGLDLWYQDEVRGNVLWAYNETHLIEIKNYVKAELRERSTHRFKMTMVEKLPSFIKSAKNRDEVLQSIERMLYKQN